MLKVRCADIHKLSCLEESKNKRAVSVALLDTLCWSKLKIQGLDLKLTLAPAQWFQRLLCLGRDTALVNYHAATVACTRCLGMFLNPLNYWDL